MPVTGTPLSGAWSAKTLLEIRQQVVRESGHWELVVDGVGSDWTDNGANAFINDAVRWLDRHSAHKKDATWILKPLSSGDAVVTLDIARFIKQVWVVIDGERTRLHFRNWSSLREDYGSVPISALDTGAPLYWTVPVSSLAPEQDGVSTEDSLTTAGFVDLDHLQFSEALLHDAIMVLPPPGDDAKLHILGVWHSLYLDVDTDKNFWTVNAPGLLVDATRREMAKRLHRNHEEMGMFESDLRDNLQELFHDMVAEEVSGRDANQMRMLSKR